MYEDPEFLAQKRKMSPLWAERAEFVAGLLPQGLRIIDIGCGKMDFERFVKPTEYRPVDRFPWDERTRIINLRQQRLPFEWFEGCDLASLLGVLEYFADPRPILDAIAEAGCALAFSYHPTDLTLPDGTRHPTWQLNITTLELEAMLAEAGFEIAKRVSFKKTQRIYVCYRAGCRPDWLGRTAPYRSVAVQKKPTLVVAGFYARGNCGDEALLQCVCEAMRPDFDILISLDEHGAYGGYWDWFPYDTFPRTHQTNLGFLRWTEKYAGLLVGGGGLPYGFGANQALHARTYGAATALAGVDFGPVDADPRLRGEAQRAAFVKAVGQYADLFDFRALRSKDAVDIATEHGLEYFHGADWALRLQTDEDPSVERDERRAMIVVREVGLRHLDYRFIREVTLLLEELKERGFAPHLLPFAPEDERFLDQIDLDRQAPVVRTWWNPRRAKQWIASSGLTVSVGRLHPLIFAAPTGTRVASLWPGRSERTPLPTHRSKIAHICRELGIRHFFHSDELLATLDSIGPADPDKVTLSLSRLDAMIERLRILFKESADRRAAAPMS